MTVNISWISQINVIINTALLQAPTFNTCMVVGVFPIASAPTSWAGDKTKVYSDVTSIIADFSPKITGTTLQDNRYQWLINDAIIFFAQRPAPSQLIIAQMEPTATPVDAMTNWVNSNNSFFAFTVADVITAASVSAGTGWKTAIENQVALGNIKYMLQDTVDTAIATTIQTAGGSDYIGICNHSQNFTPIAGGSTSPYSYAAGLMGAYFTTLFTSGVGLKPISGQQILGLPGDPLITTSNIGIPGQVSGLINTGNNVFPSFGNTGLALAQYGYASSSKPANQRYIHEIIGAAYIQLVTQADLFNLILSYQPQGGLQYDDTGIQLLVNTFCNALQKGVGQKIIQQFKLSDISYKALKDVSTANQANKIYNDLSANLKFLSRIQRVSVNLFINI